MSIWEGDAIRNFWAPMFERRMLDFAPMGQKCVDCSAEIIFGDETARRCTDCWFLQHRNACRPKDCACVECGGPVSARNSKRCKNCCAGRRCACGKSIAKVNQSGKCRPCVQQARRVAESAARERRKCACGKTITRKSKTGRCVRCVLVQRNAGNRAA